MDLIYCKFTRYFTVCNYWEIDTTCM